MLGSSWPAIQAYILGVSESCFIKIVMPWPPSVNFLLNRGRLRSEEFYNLQSRHKGERNRWGRGRGAGKAWTGVLGGKLSSKDVFLK